MDKDRPTMLPDDYVIIRLPEVIKMTGLSRTTVYRLISAGEFPRAVPLTESTHRSAPIGFLLSEVKAWITRRLEARDSGVPPANR
jgi:prophage regulatory protein